MAGFQGKPFDPIWTVGQRRALLGLLTVLLLVLILRYALNPAYVPKAQPQSGARSAELASRLDPNSADWQTLAAIPSLGEKRAREIVAYRDKVHATDSTAVVFRTADDLARVRGIGKATVENLRPYLLFPTSDPASPAR
jgi:DNA uptake protein ComE-like DNA-binding protein